MVGKFEKCTTKEMDEEVEGYRYYIYNQKNEIVMILGVEKPILRLRQIVRIKKDELGNIPDFLDEKEIVTILKFRLTSEESKDLIIQILSSKDKRIWISPANVKTH